MTERWDEVVGEGMAPHAVQPDETLLAHSQGQDLSWFLQNRLRMRQLLLLVALADSMNIHGAAKELGITQPGASRQLRELEALLGVPLFERHSKGVAPTLFGETMIRHARMALTSLDLAQHEIAALNSGLMGTVELGSIMAPAMQLLPRAIARVKSQFPMMRIGVTLDASHALIERVRQGSLDFMIGRLRDQSADLAYDELSDEPVCVVGRAGHALSGESDIGLKQLAEQVWVLPPSGSALRHLFEMRFRRAGLNPPANYIETKSLLLVVALLQQADYLHVMPVDVARYYAALGVFSILPVEIECKLDAFGIIRKRGRILSPGAGLLYNTISQMAAAASPAG